MPGRTFWTLLCWSQVTGDPAQDLCGLSPQGEVCGRRWGLGEAPTLPGPHAGEWWVGGLPGNRSPVGNGQAGGTKWAPPKLGAPGERALTVLF